MSDIIWSSPENTKPNDVIKQDTNSSNICRILVDPSIKSKIKLDDIFISEGSNGYASNATAAGITYPVICINNHIVRQEEIDYMEINCNDLLPSIYLQITTSNDNLIYKDPPKDGDIISVFIRTTTDIIVPLRCDFIINNNNSGNKIKSNQPLNNKMILNGVLFIPGIYSELSSYGKIGTSKEVLQSVAKKLNIGFATNEMNNLSDKQLWISPKNSLRNFIKHITEHSWLDEQSFFKSWIDIYYNLNFINVNKMLISNDSEIDITGMSSIQDITKGFKFSTDQSNTQTLPKIFTNVIDNMKKTPFYIIEWTPYNQSSKITEKYGSRINTHEFFHNQTLFNNEDDPYVSLMNTQMYDPKKIESHILLRGRTKYNANIADEYDMAHENVNTDDINTHSRWCGIEYVINDDQSNDDINTWSGNVNKNYNRSYSHNLLNNVELDKMFINIKVVGPCLQVMRGECVPVILNYTPGITRGTINNSTGINKLYSGMYFVDSYKIIYKYNSNPAGFSNFTTEFTLKRREWPAPVDIQKD